MSARLIKSSGNVYEDVGFDNIEAKELQFRSTLMVILNKYIQDNDLTQAEAAKLFNVSQPRISNLMSGHVDLFSTRVLLSMLEGAGFKVYERIEEILKAA